MSAVPASPSVELGEAVQAARAASIHSSSRRSRLVAGSHSEIYDQMVICFGDCHLTPPGLQVVTTNRSTFLTRDLLIRHHGLTPSEGSVAAEEVAGAGANALLLACTPLEQGAVVAAYGVVGERMPACEVRGGMLARKMRERSG